MKQVVFLQHNGGQLANQLWPAMSIYAYCLEKGYSFQNYSFFEYANQFNLPVKSRRVEFLYFGFFRFLRRFLSFKVSRKIVRHWYGLYVNLVRFFQGGRVISSQASRTAVYLPSSQTLASLEKLEENKRVKTIYFDGWLFRNPQGLAKHREKIIAYFGPKREYVLSAREFIGGVRQNYKFLVGVHLRQRKPGDSPNTYEQDLADWQKFEAKPFFYPQHLSFVRDFLEKYLINLGADRNQTVFVICSNGKLDTSFLKGLNYVSGKNNSLLPVEDLLILASCDVIIGSNTSYGPLAAYWGDKPFIVLQEHPDWEYYRGKTRYFENKNLTAVQY